MIELPKSVTNKGFIVSSMVTLDFYPQPAALPIISKNFCIMHDFANNVESIIGRAEPFIKRQIRCLHLGKNSERWFATSAFSLNRYVNMDDRLRSRHLFNEREIDMYLLKSGIYLVQTYYCFNRYGMQILRSNLISPSCNMVANAFSGSYNKIILIDEVFENI